MSRPDFGTQIPIDGYGDGGFRIGGVFHKGSQLLLPLGQEAWPHLDLEHARVEDFQPVVDIVNEIDFLLIGCGADIARAPLAAREHFEKMGLAVELMNTGAACRTYNVLIAEQRALAALLIAVD